MNDEQCVRFLQWALPRLRMRWPGFRKVRKQVRKRLDRRIRDLGLADVDDYRYFLTSHADEWPRLDSLCRITISRFCRDRGVFAALTDRVLPTLLDGVAERGDRYLRAWSAGCGSGEEPYTLSILWNIELQPRHPGTTIDIVATDADPNMIRRAHQARYGSGSLKDLPQQWRIRAFKRQNATHVLKPEFRQRVRFVEQDIREVLPEGPFDLVLCRNLVFTYYDDALQSDLLSQIIAAMRRGGALILGVHEDLPQAAKGLSPWFAEHRIYRKTNGS